MSDAPVYLDHAATTPLRPEAREAMAPYLAHDYANPSSVYREAQRVRSAVESARETVAACLHVRPTEIVFTSGGSESNNAAIKGAALALRPKGSHVITTAIEHHAVIHPIEDLEEMYGFRRTVVPVPSTGVIDPAEIERAIEPDTVFMSTMWANNEIGTVQPVQQLAEIARQRGVVMHSDAVQAVGGLPVDLSAVGVDLLSLSAHKFYGPRGAGVLVVRQGTPWRPLISGGAQERNRRAGTENVAGIVGLAEALRLACAERDRECGRLARLRDHLVTRVLTEIPGTHLNGHPHVRLSNNANLRFDGLNGESLLVGLDLAGIMASSGSACSSGSTEPSHVLTALGLRDREAGSSVRFTLGRHTSLSDVDRTVDALRMLVARLRRVSLQAAF